jgi:hypothetical protein
MNTLIMLMALTVQTPEQCNGAIVLERPKFDWNEFHYVPPKSRGMFEKPKKVPSITRVHRVRYR